jgi:AraC family ethanolamine operon transcriptional activator
MPNSASVGRIATDDIDEFRLLAPPWDVNHRQFSTGMFHSETEFLQVNGMILYRERYSKRIIVSGATPAGYFIFGGPCSAANRILWCAAHLSPQSLAFGAPSSSIDIVIPESDTFHVALLVPEALLACYLDEEGMLALARMSHWLGNAQGSGVSLITMIDRLIRKYQHHSEHLADQRLCQAIEWHLLGSIAELIFGATRCASSQSPRQRQAAVRRAMAFAEDLRVPLTVPDLAVAARVSQRTLELAFRETLGITPRNYLRWNRLNRVRRDLLDARKEETSVGTAADGWGFTEMGRFAVEYRQLFGELPSATLARSARRPQQSLADIMGIAAHR